MQDISKASMVLKMAIEKKLIPKLIEAQRETAKKVWEDTCDSSPMVKGNYVSSIQLSETKYDKSDGVISTSIFSDLKVGGNIPKWRNVLLANFINWGTGPLGEETNKYPHGYSYTTDAPWNLQAEIQYQMTGTWGMKATPHFYNSLQKNIPVYKKNIREVFK